MRGGSGSKGKQKPKFAYLEHYLSATPEAAHINGMLSRLYQEIQTVCGLEETMPMPDKAPLVRELFPDLCDAAANVMTEVRDIKAVHSTATLLFSPTRLFTSFVFCIGRSNVGGHHRRTPPYDWW